MHDKFDVYSSYCFKDLSAEGNSNSGLTAAANIAYVLCQTVPNIRSKFGETLTNRFCLVGNCLLALDLNNLDAIDHIRMGT